MILADIICKYLLILVDKWMMYIDEHHPLLICRWLFDVFFMFVCSSFNCTLDFFSSCMKYFIYTLFKCFVGWLLFSRIGNDVLVMCWIQENIMLMIFWVLSLCISILRHCIFLSMPLSPSFSFVIHCIDMFRSVVQSTMCDCISLPLWHLDETRLLFCCID